MDDLKGKRRASRSPEKEDTSDAKRLCSSRSRDIIVIDSDSDTQDQPSRNAPSKPPSSGKRQPEADEVLKVFRVKSTSLTSVPAPWPYRPSAHRGISKEKYQILYFPLTDPLNESQKRARRVVTSVKVSWPATLPIFRQSLCFYLQSWSIAVRNQSCWINVVYYTCMAMNTVCPRNDLNRRQELNSADK